MLPLKRQMSHGRKAISDVSALAGYLEDLLKLQLSET